MSEAARVCGIPPSVVTGKACGGSGLVTGSARLTVGEDEEPLLDFFCAAGAAPRPATNRKTSVREKRRARQRRRLVNGEKRSAQVLGFGWGVLRSSCRAVWLLASGHWLLGRMRMGMSGYSPS